MSEPTVTPPSEDSTPHKNLTIAEWEQVVVLWEAGAVSLQDLSDRFGISRPSLSLGLKKRGSIKGSRAKEFARVTEESLKSEAQRQAETIRNFKAQYQRFGDYIMVSAIQELQEIRKIARADRTKEQNNRIFTWIKHTAEVYALCRDQKFHLFDLYSEKDQGDDLPDIGVTEYTPSEISEIQRRLEVPLIAEDDPLMEDARTILGEMAGDSKPGDLGSV